MLGNGIKQTTATTGTGNLTLSPVTAMPGFSDVFGTTRPFSYTLLDSNGLFIEAGIGHMSDATTMVRDRVTATYVAGVYATASPSAANLAGTTTVICTPHAATMEAMLPTVDSVSSGVTRYLTTAGRNGAFTTAGIASLRVVYVPFLLRTAATITSLAINVATGAAGTARCGLYACGTNGYPGALLAGTTDIDTTTSGFKSVTLTTPITLPPGWYFAAVVASAGPTISSYSAGSNNQVGGNPFGLGASVRPVEYRQETVVSAVLPATASATTSALLSGDSHVPMVLVGVQ